MYERRRTYFEQIRLPYVATLAMIAYFTTTKRCVMMPFGVSKL
jgi:hypothetical protein